MEIIPGVLVDSFNTKRHGSIYFLTHWHADHYAGISNKWPYGPIYCSPITRRLLLTKYPKLTQVVQPLSLYEFHTIITEEKDLQFSVQLFDSNHMAGSVMILFRFGAKSDEKKYILHTGDMRFNSHLLKKEHRLFIQINGEFRTRYPISQLYLDNTYCDPIFQFPNRSDAIKLVKNIIDKELAALRSPNQLRVYLVTDSVGKEEAFIAISAYYQTRITLREQRYNYCKQIFEENEQSKIMDKFFILEGKGQKTSWIQAIKRSEKDSEIGSSAKNGRNIFISLTGWANLQDYHQLSQNQYIVPYSLHSNYQEIELFVSAVRPAQIIPIVDHHSERQSTNFRKVVHSYGSYLSSLMYMRQRGLGFLRRQYTTKQLEDLSITQSQRPESKKVQNSQENYLIVD